MRNVSDASQRMGQLIDDLLSLSRVTRNPMKRDALDLSVIASEVVENLRRSSPVHDVHVTIAAGLHASGDRNLMRIVLENLLANAWKFTRRAQEPRVDVGMCLKEARSVFYVRDNGAGFDMKYANKLFGAFQRLHGQSDFEGTGIGLATVQRIIRRHAGDVWAEGAVGQGATFYFTLGALGPADCAATES